MHNNSHPGYDFKMVYQQIHGVHSTLQVPRILSIENSQYNLIITYKALLSESAFISLASWNSYHVPLIIHLLSILK